MALENQGIVTVYHYLDICHGTVFIISFKEGGSPDLSFRFFRSTSITGALYSLHFDQ